MRPPRREVRTRGLLRGHAEAPKAATDRPADGRPCLEGRVRLRDPKRLEQEAGEREEEERGEEHPVAGDVDAPIGRPVVVPRRVERAIHRHDSEADRQRDSEHVEHERVAEVEGSAPEVEAEQRLRDVVLEREDRRSREEDEKPVEDQRVTEARERIAALDPAMGENDRRCAASPPTEAAHLDRPAARIAEDQPDDAEREDGRRDDDQAVPEDDLPVREAREGLARLGHTSFASSSATSKRSATAP